MAIYSPTPFTVRSPGRHLSNAPGDMTYEVEDNTIVNAFFCGQSVREIDTNSKRNIELFIKGLITKN